MQEEPGGGSSLPATAMTGRRNPKSFLKGLLILFVHLRLQTFEFMFELIEVFIAEVFEAGLRGAD
jgi:hypothetical protein